MERFGWQYNNALTGIKYGCFCYSMIVGRESFRYPLRLPKIFWYNFGNYRIRQELSFIFFPFGDLFGSSTKALAGKVQKLQNRAARVLTIIFYGINLARNISKHNVKVMVYKALNGSAPNYRCLPNEVELRIIR